jgi:hypothetical protein
MKMLKELYRQAGKNYRTWCKKAEARVARWEWCSGPAYALEPFYFERTFEFGRLVVGKNTPKRVKRGRVLPKRPASTKGKCQYGFDEHGRIVVVRHFDPRQASWAFETFLTCQGSKQDYVIEGATFNAHPMKNVLNATRAVFKEGRIISYEALGEMLQSESYRYQNDQLVQIDYALRRREGSPAVCKKVQKVSYDKEGQLKQILEKERGYPAQILYQAEKKK